MSTVQTQVKRRVIERFKVPGFRSLVKSAGLLKKVMVKLGVFEPASVEVDGVSVDYGEPLGVGADLVQVILGNATPVFNSLNESKDFYLFVKDLGGCLVASIGQMLNNNIISNNRFNSYNSSKIIRDNSEKINKDGTGKLELWKYYNSKGPPLMC